MTGDPVECAECGVRDEQVALSWDGNGWLCAECAAAEESLLGNEAPQCACDGADPLCLMCDQARPRWRRWDEDEEVRG